MHIIKKIHKIRRKMELTEKTFFDQMNFKEIFRAKEKQGIYTLGSKVHNSGMVKIVRFLDFEETHVVKFNKLVCLGDLVYHTELGIDNLSVSDVFNNLYNFYNNQLHSSCSIGLKNY